MKKIFLTATFFYFQSALTCAEHGFHETTLFAKKPAQLKYSESFILQKVLKLKNKEFRSEISIPKINFESKTKLKYFQDAIESQWGQRPKNFTNAFAVKSNEIFLIDDAGYYNRLKRCMDDSLAHEFTHYIQSKYQNYDLNDDFLELEAIEIQTQFREKYCS